jgi:hypothetical protein
MSWRQPPKNETGPRMTTRSHERLYLAGTAVGFYKIRPVHRRHLPCRATRGLTGRKAAPILLRVALPVLYAATRYP